MLHSILMRSCETPSRPEAPLISPVPPVLLLYSRLLWNRWHALCFRVLAQYLLAARWHTLCYVCSVRVYCSALECLAVLGALLRARAHALHLFLSPAMRLSLFALHRIHVYLFGSYLSLYL